MLSFLRLGLILLCLGVVFSSPVSASVPDNVIIEQPTSESALADSFADILQSAETGLATTGQQKNHRKGGEDSTFIPSISQRLISFAQHSPVSCKPDYLLAYEFPSPISPTFNKGYRIDFASTLNWPLTTAVNSARISGWKESNLQYRFSQARST